MRSTTPTTSCDVLAVSHFNQLTGDPLGFEEIEILDAEGGPAATLHDSLAVGWRR